MKQRGKKTLALLLGLALSLGVMAGMSMTAYADGNVASVTSGQTTTEYGSFDEAVSAWNSAADGAKLTLLADVTTASTVTVSGGTKTLDLNGYGIKMTGNGRVLVINNGANVTLNDGNSTRTETGTNRPDGVTGGYITGGKGNNNGAGIFVNQATVTMTGGNITGNTAGTGFGGGVCVDNGYFEMTGGTITNNFARYGGGVDSRNCNAAGKGFVFGGTALMESNSCTSDGGGINIGASGVVYLTGGTITGNTANGSGADDRSGGIAFRDGGTSLNISGSPVVSGNTRGNILLYANKRITVSGALTNDDGIGITMRSLGVFTNSATTANNDASKFTSDNTSYIIGKNTAGQLLLGAPYTVTYDGNGGGGTMTDSNNPYVGGSQVTTLVNDFTPPEQGKKFAGWTTQPEGGTTYTSGATFTINANTTLYAQWAEPVASVTSGQTTEEYGSLDEAVSVWNSAADGAKLTLLADVTTASTVTVSDGTKTLDLNGYGVKKTGTGRVFDIKNAANVTLIDSETTRSNTGNNRPNGVTGGYITGGSGDLNGTGIHVNAGGRVTMTGGTITGNQATGSTTSYGAGVCVDNAYFEMTGGAITGNSAKYGGGVQVQNCTSSGTGFVFGGTAVISNNVGRFDGGGINIGNNGVVSITGGTITGNTANGSNADNRSGGICFRSGGTSLSISGSPVISGNTRGNILLYANKLITVSGALTNEDSIGITMRSPGVFTNSATTANNDVSKFKSDNASYTVGKNADGQLYLGTPYTVTYDANGGSGALTDSNSPYANGSSVAVLAKGSLARDGYTFAGWKIGTEETIYANSSDNISGATASFIITGNTTLIAQWNPIPATQPTISAQPQNLALTVGYTSGSVGVTVQEAADANYTLTYQWYASTTNSNQGGTAISGAASASYTIPTGKNAGTTEYYYCVVTATRTDNGQTATATSNVATVTIGKQPAPTLTDAQKPTANTDLVYDGTAQQLVTPPAAALPEGYTGMVYALSEKPEPPQDAEYTTSIPTATDAGTYTVYYKIVGSDNWNDSEAQTVEVTIKCRISFDANGGSGTMEDGAAEKDAQYTLPECTFTAPDGKAFKEWSVQVGDADAVAKNPGDDIEVTANTTVTAVWRDVSPIFRNHSVVLGGQIGVNFYMELPEIEGYDYADSYMEFTLNGKTTQMAFASAPVDTKTGYRRFTCYLNSLQMADEIEAVFHYNNTETEVNRYSVKTYVDYVTSHESLYKPVEVELVKSIANYGHYTQPFIANYSNWTDGYNHETMPAASEIDVDAISAAREAVEGMAIVKELEGSGLSEVQYSLSFGSETYINLYVKPEDGVTVQSVTCVDAKDAGKPVTTSKSGAYRKATINKINALDLGNQYTFTIVTSAGTATVKVYPLSYAHAFLNADSYQDKTEVLQAMTALYQYYKATDNYVNGNLKN